MALRRLLTGLLLLACAGSVWAQDPLAITPRSLAGDGVANDLLGFAVAIWPASATGSSVVVAGAVDRYAWVSEAYAAAGSGAALTLAQRLTSGVGADNYGFAVAAGLNLVAIGAPGHDTGLQNVGRVYLYRPGPLGWQAAGVLDPPIESALGNFGAALAISPDGSTLAVGEPRAQRASVEVGAVHVYELGAALPLLRASVVGSGTAARFGQSVGLSQSRLLVGMPLYDDGVLADVGAVQVYQVANFVPSAEGPPLLAADRQGSDRLGLAVASFGNLLIAGAGNDDKPAGADAGSAYVYARDANGWIETQKLRSSQAQVQERFGHSLALNARYAVIGAYCLNVSGCVGPGAVYVYQRDGQQLVPVQRLSPGDGGATGHAVASNGGALFAVGAFAADGAGGVDQGALYALIDQRLGADGFESEP